MDKGYSTHRKTNESQSGNTSFFGKRIVIDKPKTRVPQLPVFTKSM